jgi:DNA processing protein
LVALLRESGASRSSVAQIEADGGPKAALERRLGLFATDAEQRASAQIEEWGESGIRLLAYTHRDFPQRVRDMDDCPPLLLLRGELEDRDARGVAVIGTRQPTPDGIRAAAGIARALTKAGRPVISGLALGVDAAAHSAALASGGRSIGVLGNGLHHVYPPAHAEVQSRLQVLVSQFWPERPPDRTTFPRRNALMSALSSATVIVEAGPHSGARIQARHALAQGRPLFLCAPLLRQDWARALVPRAGVQIITTPGELIRELR